MPNIIIREVDLTTPGVNEVVTTNTAYIPGYAVTGPVNIPTLCETVEEFESIFGLMPYVFKNDQSDNTTFKGDYEKSYIYAKQILRAGVPVLFERVMNPGNVSNASITPTAEQPAATGKMKLTSIYPGAANTAVYYTLSRSEVTKDGSETKAYQYTLSVGRTKGNVKKVTPVNTYFVTDKDIANDKFVLYSRLAGKVDNSGLVKITFEGEFAGPIEGVSQETHLTVAESVDDEFQVGTLNTELAPEEKWKRLEDRGEYNLKFLTFGSYIPIEDIYKQMIKSAATRGDCTALIDVEDTGVDTFISDIPANKITITVNDRDEDGYSYAATFTPSSNYYCETVEKNIDMPGSYAYLTCLGPSSADYNNYAAVAGVNRGLVKNLNRVNETISTAKMDEYQSREGVSVNPIMNVRPYGYCIWGNRTLKDNSVAGELMATSFLNVRQLVSDVKKVVYAAAKSLTFEQNSDVLWINFKSKVIPTLEGMKSGNGLSDYKIERLTTNKRATVKAKITLYVVEAVEDWDFTIEISDSTVLISE